MLHQHWIIDVFTRHMLTRIAAPYFPPPGGDALMDVLIPAGSPRLDNEPPATIGCSDYAAFSPAIKTLTALAARASRAAASKSLSVIRLWIFSIPATS